MVRPSDSEGVKGKAHQLISTPGLSGNADGTGWAMLNCTNTAKKATNQVARPECIPARNAEGGCFRTSAETATAAPLTCGGAVSFLDPIRYTEAI